jgi:CRISPR-associated protein Csy1
VTTVVADGTAEWRGKIHGFIADRLQAKLDSLKSGDTDKKAQLIAAHEPSTWIADAARRVAQIQLATHTLKPLHPDARGTNLHVSNLIRDEPSLVGTHSVNTELVSDVVGNAAALDVFKFLSLEVQGESLLDRLIARDPAVLAALSGDTAQAQAWAEAFVAVREIKGPPASHTLAKQLYFPLAEGRYHLLAPLFPTSFVHAVQSRIREDRFGEAARAAREAWRQGQAHHQGFREYPELAIQKFGGTKPQNISQLNSERRGENWLLASKPPIWRSATVRPPLNVRSVFGGPLTAARSMRDAVKQLREFLARTSHNNVSIRKARAHMVADICDHVHQYAATLRELDPGWSADERCRLHEAEQLWLDPGRALVDETFKARRVLGDWQVEVSRRFANWLNAALSSDSTRLGEDEAAQWTADFHSELKLFREVLEDDGL